MVKLYVSFNKENVLYKISINKDSGIEVNCNTSIDFTKLQGYEVVNNELIFNENKYNAYVKLVQVKEQYQQALEEFNKYAQENNLPSSDSNLSNNFITFYPTYEVGTFYKVNDIFNYKGKLYKVLQAHTSQADWLPNILRALYEEVKQ